MFRINLIDVTWLPWKIYYSDILLYIMYMKKTTNKALAIKTIRRIARIFSFKQLLWSTSLEKLLTHKKRFSFNCITSSDLLHNNKLQYIWFRNLSCWVKIECSLDEDRDMSFWHGRCVMTDFQCISPHSAQVRLRTSRYDLGLHGALYMV